jgi:hypothetical protein
LEARFADNADFADIFLYFLATPASQPRVAPETTGY